MKKAFVITATIAAVLVAGVAFAMVSGPDAEDSVEAGATTTLVDHEKDTATARDVGSEDDGLKEDESEEQVEEPKDESEPKEETKEDEPAKDTDPPDFAILYPENESHFTETHLAFEGVVEPGSKVFAAGYEADVDEEGNWRIVLILSPGGNLAKFTARRRLRERVSCAGQGLPRCRRGGTQRGAQGDRVRRLSEVRLV